MSLSTMKNRILRFVPGLNPSVLESIIQDSYRQLTMMEWRKLNVIRTFTTVGFYTTGTVTVDSAGVVTPSGGATFDATFVGRHMRIFYDDSFFEVASYQAGPGTITLRDWPGRAISSPSAYSIWKIIYSISSDFKLIFSVNYNVELPKKSQWWFNQRDPSRETSGEPYYWAYAGQDSSGNIQIEIYPVPDGVYPIRVYGKRKITDLSLSDSPILDEDLIENHALIQCYRVKSSLEPKQGWDQRLSEQTTIYTAILTAAQEEDYLLYAHEDKVKDRMGEREGPVSDTYWAAHDDLE